MADRTGYIALGSNLGDRLRTLRQAVMLLDETGDVRVARISHWVETAPVGGPPGQGPYLNGAAEIVTALPPVELLAVLNRVEAALGRDRAHEPRWGSRTCDLDILLLGDEVVETPELSIPHLRMHERLFVLEPLDEIAPEAMHPLLHKTVHQMLEELRGRL